MARPLIPIFDLGGVLAMPDEIEAAAASVVGLRAADIREAYHLHRHGFDSGQSSLDYWSAVLEPQQITVDDDLARRLTSADLAQWALIRPAALANLQDLLAAGHEVYILSNAPGKMDEVLRHTMWAPHLTGVLISGVVGMAKPDLGIYRAMERMIDRADARYAFIDDRQPNVDAALAAGWEAHLWTSDADTRAWLVSLGLLEMHP